MKISLAKISRLILSHFSWDHLVSEELFYFNLRKKLLVDFNHFWLDFWRTKMFLNFPFTFFLEQQCSNRWWSSYLSTWLTMFECCYLILELIYSGMSQQFWREIHSLNFQLLRLLRSFFINFQNLFQNKTGSELCSKMHFWGYFLNTDLKIEQQISGGKLCVQI